MTSNNRGSADYLELGTWNANCSICARKRKAKDMVQNWQGLYRCPECDEVRHPQDFVRPIADNQIPAFVQPPAYQFAAFCTPEGISAIADYAVADCAIADYLSPAFIPEVPIVSGTCTVTAVSAISGYAIPGCAVADFTA